MSLLLAIIVTILGVAYILSPIDILPDVIPVLGWTDDFLVLIIVLAVWILSLGIILVDALFPILKILLILIGLIFVAKLIFDKKKK